MTAAARIQPVTLQRWQSFAKDTGPRCHCFAVADCIQRTDLVPFRLFVCRCAECGREGPQASTAEAAREMFAEHVAAIIDEIEAATGRQVRQYIEGRAHVA